LKQNFTHTHTHTHTHARARARARARVVLQALYCYFVTNPTNSLCMCSVQRM